MLTLNLIGRKFGRLTVIGSNKRLSRVKKRVYLLCRCDCGKVKSFNKSAIKSRGRGTKSCGCARLGKTNGNWLGLGEISGSLWARLKKDAKIRGWKFKLEIEDIWNLFLKQKRKCALSGVELRFASVVRAYDGTASLDRIHPQIGYLRNNVQWVHKEVNYMKQSLNEKDFLDWVRKIYNRKLR